jgi:hypothetical protein
MLLLEFGGHMRFEKNHIAHLFVWLMISEKSTKTLTLSRVIVHCRGLNAPPGIWRSHEI